jgi:hypothetical protein
MVVKDALLAVGIAIPGIEAERHPPPPSEPGRHDVTLIETRQIVPGQGLPSDAQVMPANNNLDAVRHDGRVYLAWRTAPSHFAGRGTIIQVMSSADERSWRLEHRIALESDLREPRLLSLNGSLFLYVTVLGSDPWDFEPKEVRASEMDRYGVWTDLGTIGLDGWVAWRVRMESGRPYLIAYHGGENIYDLFGGTLRVVLFTTDDGRDWRAADPRRRIVYEGGGSEADFAFAEDGVLAAVIRNEGGDGNGFGSLVCSGRADRIAEWSCLPDRRKFDSPFVFRHDGETYLVARRNLTDDGAYDRDYLLLAKWRNQIAYAGAGKRCALWRFADDGRRLAYVLDLPSRGDTCFPSVLAGARPDELIVYDYSSPLDGPDLPWSIGQRRPTNVYRHLLRFSR